MNNIEIELKFPLLNKHEVIDYLNENAVFSYEKDQHDIYYNAPHRNFLTNPNRIDERLRIRIMEDNNAEITYKDCSPWEYFNELETTIWSYQTMKEIFSVLNFKEIAEVKKKRKAWMYKNIEVSVDQVESLWDFIEVEYKWTWKDIQSIRESLHKILEEIEAKVWKESKEWYPHLLMKKNGVL